MNDCDRKCVRVPARAQQPPGSQVRHQLEPVQGDGGEAQGGDVHRGALKHFNGKLTIRKHIHDAWSILSLLFIQSVATSR